MNYKLVTLFILTIFSVSVFGLAENINAKTYTYNIDKFIKEGDSLAVVKYPNDNLYKVIIKKNNKQEDFFKFTDFSSGCIDKKDPHTDISSATSYHLVNELERAGAIYPNTRIVKPDYLGVVRVRLEWDSGVFCQNHQIVDYHIEVNGINLND